jgi:putative ATPase
LDQILKNAISDKKNGFGKDKIEIDQKGADQIIASSNGDARFALNVLEAAFYSSEKDENGARRIDFKLIKKVAGDSSVLYDKMGSEHFDHASAYQKSLRGSDPDAAIYWLAKMIAGGEDLKFISRRLVVTASEDVGNADPSALMIAVSAAEASEKLGMPEARIPLAQATIYVACAPKSNSSIKAIDKALTFIQKKGHSYPVPDHLKDSHYKGAASLGYGVGYKYPHNYPNQYVQQNYLPDKIKDTLFYEPGNSGAEKEMKEYLKKLKV